MRRGFIFSPLHSPTSQRLTSVISLFFMAFHTNLFFHLLLSTLKESSAFMPPAMGWEEEVCYKIFDLISLFSP